MRRALSVALLVLPGLWFTGMAFQHPVEAAPVPTAVLELYAIVPGKSQVAYHVGEIFINQHHQFHVAVGVTRTIHGDVWVDRAHPGRSRVGSVNIDISQFKSDDAGRDASIRALWLESSKYPIASFTPTAIQGLPDAYAEGREVPVRITGNLRIRKVTKPTTFTGQVELQGGTLTGIMTTKIMMTDFGFNPPSILGFLKTGNEVNLELRFTARPVGNEL